MLSISVLPLMLQYSTRVRNIIELGLKSLQTSEPGLISERKGAVHYSK